MEIQDIPELYNSPYLMNNPNEKIIIHSGAFVLKNAEKNIEDISVIGTIVLTWFPGINVILEGEVKVNHSFEVFQWITEDNYYNVIIDEDNIGNCFITNHGNARTVEGETIVNIKAVFSSSVVLGNISERVNEIRFSLPNIKRFPGDVVRHGTRAYSNRISLSYDGIEINIDLSATYKELYDKLKNEGGYIFLASGILKSDKPIKEEKAKDILFCLSRFLTFLNGRRLSSFCRQGYLGGEIQWTDFSNYHVDIYKNSPSVVPVNDFINFNDLWEGFRKLWIQDQDFIRTSVHWFVEANNDSIFIEGAIILSQTNLELLFNWLIVESRKIILGRDGENMSAANKIRVLLSQINLSAEVPEECVELLGYLSRNNNFQEGDGPEIITFIRNAIVHSQKKKRVKLEEIDRLVRHETLRLSLWYIERVLLHILDYEDKYYNRISRKVEMIA